MKCIHCGADSKLKERPDGKCKDCKRSFAFNLPAQDPYHITDGAFLAAIKAVSTNGEHWFTERQLWYELNRRVLRKRFWRGPWGAAAGMSFAGGVIITAMGAVAGPAALVAVGLVGGASALIGCTIGNSMTRKKAPGSVVISHDTFTSKYLQRWSEVHGSPEKMLPLNKSTSGARTKPLPPDVAQYSFDRALVVETDTMAEMLVANRFHFENNCAILSRAGYPHDIRATIMEMLQRNPLLKVFVVHNASINGCGLAAAMREKDWFPDTSVQVIDLGLRPAHVMNTGMIVAVMAPASVPDRIAKSLKPDEKAWLEAGNAVELAVLRPAKLMRSIYQGVARAKEIDNDSPDSGLIIWGYDGGADVYAADSFG